MRSEISYVSQPRKSAADRAKGQCLAVVRGAYGMKRCDEVATPGRGTCPRHRHLESVL